MIWNRIKFINGFFFKYIIMIELWIILTLTAAFFWALSSLFDKFILSHELKDPFLAATVSGIVSTPIFVIPALLLKSTILISFNLILVTFFAGVFAMIAFYFYLSAVRRAEISRVSSFLSITPIFVLFFAFVFLGERLTSLNYFGIIFLVFWSFLISLKKNTHSEYRIHRAFLILIFSSLFYALRDVIMKFASLNVSVWSAMFWLGLGICFTSIFMLIKHHPHLKKKAVKGIKHLIFVRIVTSFSLLIFLIAISLNSVSLVSALAKLQILFVFIGTLILSRFHPHILKEKITTPILIQKVVAIIAILAGTSLII